MLVEEEYYDDEEDDEEEEQEEAVSDALNLRLYVTYTSSGLSHGIPLREYFFHYSTTY